MARPAGKGIAAAVVWAVILAGSAVPARAQWQITSPDGKANLKLGLLVQGQAEWMEVPEVGDPNDFDLSRNIFIRRFRILGGGNVTEKLSFFFETDSPNLGKGITKVTVSPGGTVDVENSKEAGDIYLQDLFVTYSLLDEFKIEGGLMLTPNSHNSETSAAALLPIDYGPYSFLASTPTLSRVGRDWGAQARGYLFKHFEYRFGIYQGFRGENSTAPFRYVGRVVAYVFEPETGFFYTGTSLGAKKILALGFSGDGQETYRSYGGDIFMDLPIPNGDGLTLQGDYIYYDGNDTFQQLPVQNTWLAEAGYYNKAARLGPFVQIGVQDFADPDLHDENRYQGGLAYWALGHRFNLKAGYTQIVRRHELTRSQVVLQCQIFMF